METSMLPIQITFHGIEPSPALAEHVRVHAERLARVAGIVRGRVAIDRPHAHHRHGSAMRVSIELSIPGHVLVEHSESDDAYVAVREAFDRLRRQLVAARSRANGRGRAAAEATRTIRGVG
jgi:ribosomal subunit interface protein